MLKYTIEYVENPKAWTTEIDVGIVNSNTIEEARKKIEKTYELCEIKSLTIEPWTGPDVIPLAPDSIEGLV